MKNKLEYRIEDGSLIIDNYFNDLKIGSINGGRVENILNKCKLYDEEYETLLKENEYMKHIAKGFEQLQQENKQLKDNIRQIDNSVDKLQKQLIKEKDNWNKLKEYVNKMHEYFLYTDVNEIYKQSMKEDNSFPNLFNLSELNASDRILSSIFKKMQELEQGSDSNE